MLRSAIEVKGLSRRLEKVRAFEGIDESTRRNDAGGFEDGEDVTPGGSLSIGWTIRALMEQGMPSEEIGLILEADDPELIRRYFELHRERLEERLTDHRRTLTRLERLLAARSIGSAARREETKAGGG